MPRCKIDKLLDSNKSSENNSLFRKKEWDWKNELVDLIEYGKNLVDFPIKF